MLKIIPKETTAGSVEEDMQGVNTYNWVMIQIRTDTVTVVKAAECDRRESSHRTMDEEEEEKNLVADLYSGSEDRK